MKSNRAVPALILGALTILTTACNGSQTATEGTEGKGLIEREVVMTDYEFEPEHMKVQAGETVRFIVKNDGDFTHEFRVLVDPPKYVEVAPNSKDRLDVVFDQGGDFEYVCTVGDHERLGMKGEITVEAVE